MSSEERDFEKMVAEFNVSDTHKFLEDEQKELTKAEKRALEQKQKLIQLYAEKVSQRFFRAFEIAASRIAIDSIMDASKRQMIVHAFNNTVLPGLHAMKLGLIVEEKFVQQNPILADSVNNMRIVIENLLKFSKDYMEKINAGWNSKGAKVMIEEVKHRYETDLSFIEHTVWHNLPNVESRVKGARRGAEGKLHEALRLVA